MAARGQYSGRQRGLWTLIGIAAILVLMVSINLLTARLAAPLRLDLTQNKLYSVAKGTKTLLADLKEPVTLTLYYSPDLGRRAPNLQIYADRVRDLLHEYVTLGKGRLIMREINPQAFSPEEDEAEAAGLQAVPLDTEGARGFFGLVGTNSIDGEETIALFQPDREELLEYDLTSLVNKLAKPKKPVIGLISGLQLEGGADPVTGEPQGNAILDSLANYYTIKPLETSVTSLAGIDVLMLVHPGSLAEPTRRAIDHYVLGGGKALIFVDPVSEIAQHQGRGTRDEGGLPPPASSDLPDLFKSWGVQMVPDKVIGDLNFGRKVRIPPGYSESNIPYSEHVGWLSLPQAALNRTSPITADLTRITVATAGILEQLPNATTTFTPLIHSSIDSEAIDAAKLRGAPDIIALVRDFHSDGKERVIAAEISGPAASAFATATPSQAVKNSPDASVSAANKGPVPAPPAPTPPTPTPPSSTPPATATSATPGAASLDHGTIDIVIVTDTDFLADRTWLQREQSNEGGTELIPIAGNGDFVANALDHLSGQGALTGLRGRGVSSRPFTRIEAMEQAAETEFRTREHELREHLSDTEAKLRDVEAGPGQKQSSDQAGQNLTLSADQVAAIDKFRQEALATRSDLRQVERSLRRDIDRLEAEIRIVNIAGVPVVLILIAVGLSVVRGRRRRTATRLAME